jgi:hypothetical protein
MAGKHSVFNYATQKEGNFLRKKDVTNDKRNGKEIKIELQFPTTLLVMMMSPFFAIYIHE